MEKTQTQENRTYKQLAELWGITKPTVKAAKNKVEPDLMAQNCYTVGNTIWFTPEGQELIKQKLCHAPVPPCAAPEAAAQEPDSAAELVEALKAQIQSQQEHIHFQQEQLKAKDEQIDNLLNAVKIAQTLQVSVQQQLDVLRAFPADASPKQKKVHFASIKKIFQKSKKNFENGKKKGII